MGRSDSVALLLFVQRSHQLLVSDCAVLEVVGQQRVLADQNHQQRRSVHGPPTIVSQNLVDLVARKKQHGLRSHQKPALRPLQLYYPEHDHVLDVDGVHALPENVDLKQRAYNEGIPVADGGREVAHGVAQGDQGGHAEEQPQEVLRQIHLLWPTMVGRRFGLN